jgi:hypothetical protein
MSLVHPKISTSITQISDKATMSRLQAKIASGNETTSPGPTERPNLLQRLSLHGQHILVKSTKVQTPPVDCTMGMSSSQKNVSKERQAGSIVEKNK